MSAETYEQRLLQRAERISVSHACKRNVALLLAYSELVAEVAQEIGVALLTIGERWQLEDVFARMEQHAKSGTGSAPKEPA